MKDQRDHILADLLPANQPDAPPKRGRPSKHINAAAKQKAYRERQKEKGLREVKRYVRDIDAPLSSDVIDLSEVRPWYR